MIKSLLYIFCFVFAITSFAETEAETNRKIQAAKDSYTPFIKEIMEDYRRSLKNHGKSHLELCGYSESIDVCVSRISVRYDSLRSQAATDSKNRDWISIRKFYFSKENAYERDRFNQSLKDLYNVPDVDLVGEYIYHTGIYPFEIEYNDQRCVGYLTRAIRKLSSSSARYYNPFSLGTSIKEFQPKDEGDILAAHGIYGIAAFYRICNEIYAGMPMAIDKYEKIVVNEYKEKILSERASVNMVVGNIVKNRELSKDIRQRLGVKDCCSMYSKYPLGSEYELVKERGLQGNNFKFQADREQLVASLLSTLNSHSSEIKKINAGRAIEDWIETGISFKNLPESLKADGNWFVQRALDVSAKNWKSKRDFIISNSSDEKTQSNMISNYKVFLLMNVIEEVKDISGCGANWSNNKTVLASYLMLKKSSQMISPNLPDAYTAGNLVFSACVLDKPEWSGFLLKGIVLK